MFVFVPVPVPVRVLVHVPVPVPVSVRVLVLVLRHCPSPGHGFIANLRKASLSRNFVLSKITYV